LLGITIVLLTFNCDKKSEPSEKLVIQSAAEINIQGTRGILIYSRRACISLLIKKRNLNKSIMKKIFTYVSFLIVMITMLFILINMAYWLFTGDVLMDRLSSSNNFRR
jgi:hypothetical protein